MRALTMAVALLGVASCTTMPDSGYNTFGQYEREREMILNAPGNNGNATLQNPSAVSGQPLSAMSSTPGGAQTTAAGGADGDAEDIASQTSQALAGTGGTTPVGEANTAGGAAATGPLGEAVNSYGISEENNFKAVGEQRSIQQDKEFIAKNRAAYQQIEPTALPQRASGDGPNIVTYALQTTQAVGTPLYKRSGFNAEGRYTKNCAKYASPDQAQMAFLSNGGPKKDPQGLDPDGDGFACTWDPTPFRKAAGN
ncbi:hypothetical protein KM176_12275 [Pseudooceanicola sp. CBS1P-1]|uniref:Excalibur calcium-binding domain-containing protein n=1 Tax=Pseudooceanicola albus TaxID=2692189 RepID=A0A6L7G4P4_9RHOB|nr:MULTISPECIES: hypothetical protein [Pseudooceanicola]MBT9384639.1 hypothetical protein [Pseudooceanicola endophyticus]MXN18340.1 hypothetical protein [Pseudooceanicola albus]